MLEFGKQIVSVRPRFDSIVIAAGDWRHEHRGSSAGLWTSDEQPILAPDRHRLNGPFRDVVVDRPVAIFQIAIERRPLVARVTPPSTRTAPALTNNREGVRLRVRLPCAPL